MAFRGEKAPRQALIHSHTHTGHDEVDPDSLSPRNDLGGLGATIIDSLDTLHIMNLTAEFADAKAWVRLPTPADGAPA